MIIREGQKEDMPAVLELIRELAVFEKEPEAVVITAEDLVKDGFSENPLFNTFVALEGDDIIGAALFYPRYSTWKGKTIHLEDLIVRESKRKFGVGKKLYNKVLEYAKNEGVRRVEWVVLDWNQNAIDFYEKSGATVFDDWKTVQMDENGLKNYFDN
ncbi:GNAT family N-acetyltransferase [Aureivirga sp. CE67]|uniref:GNAT family N-acetyltransferase n=1 Tax=Aureivirga sp. CE67 TaxID=1788983 RepID=UPI00397D9FC0